MRTDSNKSNPASDAARRYLAPLSEYKTTARSLFPTLERGVLDGCSISPSDALFLGYFLEHGPPQVLAMEIGADMGASTLCFASHPKVAGVVNVNPNPLVTEEISARSGPQTADKTYDSPEDLKVLDVARTIIGEYPEERQKASFFEGAEVAEAVVDAQLPGSGLPEADGLVVLMEGLQTRELVSKSLIAIFDRKPHAVVLLDCRLRGGRPSSQAGVADFMEQADDGYRFVMVGDLGPALASCNLGVLYPVPAAASTEKILADVAREFSSKLDPLRLLVREEELMNTVSRINHQFSRIAEENGRLEKEASRFQERIPRLEARIEEQKSRNAALLTQYSRMRYRAANIVAEGLLKLPGAKDLLTKTVSALRQRK